MIAEPFLVAEHLGHLQPWQQVLVALLAFGPFILLGIVVVVVRRQDIAEEEAAALEDSTNPETGSRGQGE